MGLLSWVDLNSQHATRLGEKNLFITRIDGRALTGSNARKYFV
jgi:hypothetical protein